MRCAVVVALGDPRSTHIEKTWSETVAWLREELAEFEYSVAVVDREDVLSDLAQVLEEVTSRDELLFHISGTLTEPGVLRTASGRRVRLDALGAAVAAHPGVRTSVFVELLHEDGSADAFQAADHVTKAIEAMEARPRGYPMVAAVRAASAGIEGLPLTRLFLEAARAQAEGRILSSAIHERVLAMPESPAFAQSFAFVRGLEESVLLPSPPPTAPPSLVSLPSFTSPPLPTFQGHPVAPPVDERPLDDQIDDASNTRQWRRAVQLRRERLQTIEPVRLRVRELVAIARILQVELDDAEGALGALEEARAVDPTRIGVLQALRRAYERLGRWEGAIATLDALADLASSGADRAELLHAQALLVRGRLADSGRAIALLEMAIASDATHARARAELESLRSSCAAPPDREAHDASDDVAPSDPTEVCAPRTVGGEQTLPDYTAPTEGGAAGSVPAPEGDAVAAVEEAVAAPPSDGVLERIDPNDHAASFAVHWHGGRTDAAFLAALALEDLGVANPEQQGLVDRLRSMSPIRARGTLDASGWELLRAQGSDERLAALFAAAGRAAVAARLEQLVARKRLVVLDPARRLDETSTASVVRSFQWAARVLGVACPALYMVDNVPGEIAAVRAHEASTALGPSVLRGRSAKDLAFVAARHLTYYRPEHQVLVYFPTGDDLGRLLAATFDLGSGRTSREGGVAALRERLEALVSNAERESIVATVRGMHSACDLGAWARSVELTAGRAGLLLCGDLATASAVLRSESRAIAALSSDDKRCDLIEFCSSPEHAELRARFVVATPSGSPSAPPPAMLAAAGAAEPRA